MDEYETRYEALSNGALLSLFGTESWDRMGCFDRINACQEVENRYAQANNMEPCRVTIEPMEGACYGYHQRGIICLNSHMLNRGVFVSSYLDENGRPVVEETPVLAANWNTLDTVFHEGTHGLQVARGTMPRTYIRPEMDGDLYRIQGPEKEAFAVGQNNTLAAIQLVQQESGVVDREAAVYYASVQYDSFQAALQNAAAHYNDPNIESTLAQVIWDRDNGVTPQDPSPSYTAINSLCDGCGLQAAQGHSAEVDGPGAGIDDGAAGLGGNMGDVALEGSGAGMDDGATALESDGGMSAWEDAGGMDGGSGDGMDMD